MTNLSRSLYRCLVQLHPPAFRRRFAPEMLWIFDEIADHDARIELFSDALMSLARQWVVRVAIQKLLIGELRFGPLPATGSGQFCWERIEFDDRPLPPPLLPPHRRRPRRPHRRGLPPRASFAGSENASPRDETRPET